MDHMIYTALSGAKQTLARQSVVANNMANASTPGFRAELSAYRAVQVNGTGLATRAIVADSTPGSNFQSGTIQSTGRSLDVAIDGPGWLAVQSPDGSEGYTRSGGLQVDSTGVLRSNGHAVMGENGPLVLPLGAEQIGIASDGTISALGPGEQPNTLAEVGRLKLVNPAERSMIRGEDGLFHLQTVNGQPAPAQPADERVHVVSGAIESSNVNPTEAMVAMIDNARRFEMNMKMLQSADENDQKANSLLSLS